MTDKTDFTEDEWARLKRAPFIAGMAISLADPGGPIEVVKETAATLKVVRTAAEAADYGPFVTLVAADAVADAKARHNPLADFKPKGALAGKEILAELGAINELVSGKAAADEAESFRAWLRDAAREAADAAKEGGFLGFHAVRVSEGEQRMLDELDGVLGAAG